MLFGPPARSLSRSVRGRWAELGALVPDTVRRCSFPPEHKGGEGEVERVPKNVRLKLGFPWAPSLKELRGEVTALAGVMGAPRRDRWSRLVCSAPRASAQIQKGGRWLVPTSTRRYEKKGTLTRQVALMNASVVDAAAADAANGEFAKLVLSSLVETRKLRREWLKKNGVEDVASSRPALPLQKSRKVEKVGKKRRRRLP